MNILLIGVAGVIGFVVGFVAGVFQVKEIRESENEAHERLIERKNKEIYRLRTSNNELQARNNAQRNAFDRINGHNDNYFTPF